jgi:DNA replication protein DnaC
MKGSLAYERLHANLQTLNLSTIERSIDVALENGAKGPQPLTEVFDDLIDREVKARQALSTETRARLAGFPVRKTLEEFEFEFQPSIDPTLVRELATMRFVHNAENVILVGPAGVGKTHLAIALGMEAAKAGFSVTFMSASRALGKLRQASDRGLLERALRNLCRSRLLILDEIGYLPWDRTMAHLFFRIIENRYERASTIFTSNKPYSEWGEVLGDPVLAAAVLDRVLHHSTTVNIRGDSYRLRVRRKAGTPTPVVPLESKVRSTASGDSSVRDRRR